MADMGSTTRATKVACFSVTASSIETPKPSLVRTEYLKKYTRNRAWERLREKVEKVYKLDYSTLKMLCVRWSPDSIPIKPAIDKGRLISEP
jgi:hypothetical protein